MTDEKPCLVPARQGFSVFYKGRHLYSAYNPLDNCSRLVSSLTILPGSLILIFSPLLGYGIQTLLDKIDGDSFIIAIETDKNLHDFSLPYLSMYENNPRFKYLYLTPDASGISLAVNFLSSSVKKEKAFFPKRSITVNLSSASIPAPFKDSLTRYIDLFIDNFWKNRLTITRMGRMYGRNIFKNLSGYSGSVRLKEGCIQKPFIVLGAGASLEDLLKFLKIYSKRFFIICVDSAVYPLLEQGIVPDMIIAVECQLANLKAFIGSANSHIHLDADITSRPRIQSILKGQVSFFLSEYETSVFLDRLKNCLNIEVLPPLGSVGLAAAARALSLRYKSTPVFLSGLDFCYEPGKTHCRSAPSHRTSLSSSTRIMPAGSSYGFYSRGTENCSIETAHLITDPALKNYALLFDDQFSTQKNLYNLSPVSILQKITRIAIDDINSICMKECAPLFPGEDENTRKEKFYTSIPKSIDTDIANFLNREKQGLENIKHCLIHGSLGKEELLSLLLEHDYLYMHFPDGYKKPQMNEGFLKRIRAEIDFFLKDINSALGSI